MASIVKVFLRFYRESTGLLKRYMQKCFLTVNNRRHTIYVKAYFILLTLCCFITVDAGKLVVGFDKGRGKLAPTNEILSFRAYSALRKLNRLRKSACRLFQSDAIRNVMQKVEREVESQRLLVRRDKMLHADVGGKQKVLDMLLSYNPLWLRVGLEVSIVYTATLYSYQGLILMTLLLLNE